VIFRSLLNKILIRLFIFLQLTLYSQQSNNWYFGSQCGLNFSTSPPSPLTGGQVNSPDNSSTISDLSGNLLFYSDGLKVWDKTHNVMPNGSGLLGNATAGQCALIVPIPNSNTKYVVFYPSEFASPGYLRYSVVDMSLNNGFGDVIVAQKNISLGTGWTEKLCAYYNPNGCFYWLLAHKWNSNEFVAFKVDATNIATQFTSSYIGSIHNCGVYSGAHDAMGQLTISQDGKKVINALTCQDKYEIFDFNLNSGVLTNPLVIPGHGFKAWGTAFSPDGTKVYVNSIFGPSIFQYDISSNSQTTIISTQTIIATANGSGYFFGYMELGRDNKIYVAKPNAGSLSVVNNPNGSGSTCSFSIGGQSLGSNISTHGISRIAYNIPNGSQTGTLATSITSPTLCAGQSATIAASGASSYTWHTGVISPSMVITPSASAVYSVQSDAFACGSSGFGTVSVTVINDLNLLSNQYKLCLGDSLRISGNGTGIVLANQPTTNSVVTVSPLVNTVYTLQVIKSGPGYSCAVTRTAEVQVDEKPIPDFEISQHPCGGGVQFTNLTLGEVSEWKWNFGVGTSTLENPYHFFYNGGTYSINLVAINSKGCRASVQETISIGTPPPVSVNPKSSICYGDSVQLKAGGGIAYLWWPNLDLNSTNIENPLSKPSTSRQYSVQITTTTQVSNAPCIFTLSTLVDVTRLDRSSIQANPPWIIVGNSCTLAYNGKPGAQVAWFPVNKISPIYTLITQPQVSTIYTVIVTDGPCLQTYSIQVDVYSDKCSPSDFFVPNVFTPNGDGQNDRLFVRGNNIADLHFVVYNRWGEMVFETYLQSEGWDGTYKGRMLDAGVYAWYFKTKCMNGAEVIKKGNVSVLR